MKNFKISILSAVILAITLAAFLPCLGNGFVNWDDDAYLTDNAPIKSSPLNNINKILAAYSEDYHHPATILSYLLEYQFFKLDPLGYHSTNIILHLINTLLVFWLIYLLGGSISTALLTSVLFGIHPVHVEPVAWISGRRDVLYAAFFLGSIICYIKYLRGRQKTKYYICSIFLFTVSLLSKPAALTLPIVLFFIDYMVSGKRFKYNFMDKIPFFAICLIFAATAIHAINSGKLLTSGMLNDLPVKFSVSCYCIMFYLGKIFAPVRLSCLYPYYGPETISRLLLYPSMFIILVFAAAISLRYTKKLVFGLAFFLVVLLPALQFMPSGETIVADRYVYVASIGIFYLLAEFFTWVYTRSVRRSRTMRVLMSLALTGMICVLTFLTWTRCAVWKDSITLWSDVLKNYPDCTTAYNNRGIAFHKRGDHEKAQSDFNSMASNSNYYRRKEGEGFVFYNRNLANVYNSRGLHDKAIALLEDAVKKDTKHGYAYYTNLAVSYSHAGRMKEAVALLEELIKNDTKKCAAYYNLGLIYGNAGDRDKAVTFFRKSTEEDPDFPDANYALGVIYHNEGDFKTAISYYKKALRLDPNNYSLYNDIAAASLSVAEYGNALSYSKKAIKINPARAEAYVNLADSYFAMGKNAGAIKALKKALGINPNLGVAHNNLAIAYYDDKKYDLAIDHCDKAVNLGYKVPDSLLESLKQRRT